MGDSPHRHNDSIEVTAEDVVKRILDAGGEIVEVISGTKRPVAGQSWKNPNNKIQEISQFGADSGNSIAVYFGKTLLDVDIDNPITAKAVKYVPLPETHFIWGRKSRPRSHYLYTIQEPLKYLSLSIIEIRTGEHYSVLPPSIHKNGEQYTFYEYGEICPLTEDIIPIIKKLAVLTHLAQEWTTLEGMRSNTAGNLGAFLRFYGWEINDIAAFVQGIAECGNDNEVQNRVDYARSSAEKVDLGQIGSMEKDLREVFDSKIWREVCNWLGVKLSSNYLDPENTDTGNGKLLVSRYEDIIRFNTEDEEWYIWNGKQWQRDRGFKIYELAEETIQNAILETNKQPNIPETRTKLKELVKSLSEQRQKGMINLASKQRNEIKVSFEDLDNFPWLLNCGNGTINLRTGELLPYDKSQYLTQITNVMYNPDAKGPHSERFLQQVFHGNTTLIEYIFRLFGVAAIGEQIEHIFPIFWGLGGNGKSTLLEVVSAVFGDYGRSASENLFIAKREGGADASIIPLRGVRFTYNSEGLDISQSFAEKKIKRITGGEHITARDLYKSEISFEPTHTVFLATNSKPAFRDVTEGFWRRIKLIPFTAKFIPNPNGTKDAYPVDPLVKEKLMAEAEWWLQKIVQGCLDYQNGGLQDPPEVLLSTAEYRGEANPISEWLSTRCIVNIMDSEIKDLLSSLHADYYQYMKSIGEKPLTKIVFGRLLVEQGFEKRTSTGNHVFIFGAMLDPDRAEIRSEFDPLGLRKY